MIKQNLDSKMIILKIILEYKFKKEDLSINRCTLLGVPYMSEGFSSSSSSNFAYTYMLFCGEQQGFDLLLATNYHVCTGDKTGVSAAESITRISLSQLRKQNNYEIDNF